MFRTELSCISPRACGTDMSPSRKDPKTKLNSTLTFRKLEGGLEGGLQGGFEKGLKEASRGA